MTTALALDEVEAVLRRYAALTRSKMQHYLDGAPDRYLYDLVRDYPARAGKGLRPALLLATCEAFGGSPEEAVGAAVAIELAHNAFLVHDDIEDGSLRRRGKPTLHRLHGTPLALNAGDALAVLALRPLREGAGLGARLAERLSDEFHRMLIHTVEGQAMELGWRAENRIDLEPSDYLELIGRKTCWYTSVWPLRAGAIIGSAGTARLESLTRFGFYLGAAFQIRDDLLNLVGSEDRYGKEIMGDIREGKRTLMLIHLLASADPDERAAIVAFLARAGARGLRGGRSGDLGPPDVLDLMVRHGSLQFAFEFGQGVAAAAYDSFSEAFAQVSPSPSLAFIEGLIPYMLARSA